MLIKLNDGENITVQAKGTTSKSITIMCKGNWIGSREFKDGM